MTYALLVEHGSFVVNYGEVKKNSPQTYGWKVGDAVAAECHLVGWRANRKAVREVTARQMPPRRTRLVRAADARAIGVAASPAPRDDPLRHGADAGVDTHARLLCANGRAGSGPAKGGQISAPPQRA